MRLMPSPIINITFFTFLPFGVAIFSTAYGLSYVKVWVGMLYCALALCTQRARATMTNAFFIFILFYYRLSVILLH